MTATAAKPKAKRKPKFVQYIREGERPMFEIIEHTPGETYWHARIRDAIGGDEPEFRYTPPKKGCPYTVQELANRVAGELNEATGALWLQEVIDGVPTFMAVFASNGRQVNCVSTTDPARIAPADFASAVAWLNRRSA